MTDLAHDAEAFAKLEVALGRPFAEREALLSANGIDEDSLARLRRGWQSRLLSEDGAEDRECFRAAYAEARDPGKATADVASARAKPEAPRGEAMALSAEAEPPASPPPAATPAPAQPRAMPSYMLSTPVPAFVPPMASPPVIVAVTAPDGGTMDGVAVPTDLPATPFELRANAPRPALAGPPEPADGGTIDGAPIPADATAIPFDRSATVSKERLDALRGPVPAPSPPKGGADETAFLNPTALPAVRMPFAPKAGATPAPAKPAASPPHPPVVTSPAAPPPRAPSATPSTVFLRPAAPEAGYAATEHFDIDAVQKALAEPEPWITVEQYASFLAALAKNPTAADRLRREHGIASEEAQRLLGRAFARSFEKNPDERRRFDQILAEKRASLAR